jgi:hypothetical protein
MSDVPFLFPFSFFLPANNPLSWVDPSGAWPWPRSFPRPTTLPSTQPARPKTQPDTPTTVPAVPTTIPKTQREPHHSSATGEEGSSRPLPPYGGCEGCVPLACGNRYCYSEWDGDCVVDYCGVGNLSVPCAPMKACCIWSPDKPENSLYRDCGLLTVLP